MKFEWDEEKCLRNVEKHRIDFQEAVEIFDQPTLEFLDRRHEYGEERWQAIGWLKVRLITVVYTEREEALRIISARKATDHEETQYYRHFRS